MSSIFGLPSSYMLEYCWLFALLLRSARCFTGIEGKWTLLPSISRHLLLLSLFILMLFSLAMQKLYNLMRSHLFILSFMSLALGDVSVRMLLHGMSEIFLPMFSFKTFMVLQLIFKSFTHLEFIFVYGVSWGTGIVLNRIPASSTMPWIQQVLKKCCLNKRIGLTFFQLECKIYRTGT